jgi:hypothetical protein
MGAFNMTDMLDLDAMCLDHLKAAE